MIKGVHTMFYTSDPEGLRAFFRDKLGFPFVDVGDNWLIFDLPEADLGCHPASNTAGETNGTPSISFYCEDIESTMKELKEKGVEFTGLPENHGYGLVTHMKAPGGVMNKIYKASYKK